MRRLTFGVPALLALLLVGGCDDIDVGDLNNPGLENLQESPTRAGVLTLATGLQIGSRFGQAPQNGYSVLLGILGREVYNFDIADPRFVTEMLVGPLDGSTPAFGGNLFANPYGNIRTANILLRAVQGLPEDPIAGVTAAEREGILGYAQTMLALDFLRIIVTRDDNGAPIDVDIDPTGAPAPIAARGDVYNHIVSLLDGGRTHLQAGGSTFPFGFSPGFAGFDTPPTFLQFNRALRARVAAYLNDYAGVVAALGESFVNSAQPLTLGVYHSYSTTAGDSLNLLFDPTGRAIVAHPALETEAQFQVGGIARDARFVNKTILLAEPVNRLGLSSNRAMNVYTSPSAPISIIRNEELILLRAEANIETNTNLVDAVTDLNEIRQESGNLPPYAGLVTQDALRAELLYNRRYSLLFEQGHRWIDLRRFNLLGTLSQDVTTAGTARRFSRFPLPANECLARDPQPAQGCTPEVGF